MAIRASCAQSSANRRISSRASMLSSPKLRLNRYKTARNTIPCRSASAFSCAVPPAFKSCSHSSLVREEVSENIIPITPSNSCRKFTYPPRPGLHSNLLHDVPGPGCARHVHNRPHEDLPMFDTFIVTIAILTGNAPPNKETYYPSYEGASCY